MGSIYQREDRGGKNGKWYAQWIDQDGRERRRSTRTRSKRDAKAILAKWELEALRRQSGLIDAGEERLAQQGQKSLASHGEQWLNSLEVKNCSDQYVSENRTRLTKILSFTGWKNLNEVSAEDLEAFLVDLQSSGRYKNSAKRGARTVGQYIQTAKGFVKWCVKTGKLKADPLTAVSKPNPELDRRLERRMLLPEELTWLLQAAATETNYNVSPDQRPILYEFAIQTGLRADEIRSVAISNCDLGKQPVVSLKGSQTKNGKPARQWLTPGFSEKLKAMILAEGKAGRDPLFDLCYPSNMARMLRTDLKTARANWLKDSKNKIESKKREKTDFLEVTNFGGEQLDFHSLRHTCGAWLVMQGVNIKTVQAVMRHSNISLTLDTYGHLMPGAEEGAIPSIAKLFGE